MSHLKNLYSTLTSNQLLWNVWDMADITGAWTDSYTCKLANPTTCTRFTGITAKNNAGLSALVCLASTLAKTKVNKRTSRLHSHCFRRNRGLDNRPQRTPRLTMRNHNTAFRAVTSRRRIVPARHSSRSSNLPLTLTESFSTSVSMKGIWAADHRWEFLPSTDYFCIQFLEREICIRKKPYKLTCSMHMVTFNITVPLLNYNHVVNYSVVLYKILME